MPKGPKKTSITRKGPRSTTRSTMSTPEPKGALPPREATRDELEGRMASSRMSDRERRGEMATAGNSDDGEAPEND